MTSDLESLFARLRDVLAFHASGLGTSPVSLR